MVNLVASLAPVIIGNGSSNFATSTTLPSEYRQSCSVVDPSLQSRCRPCRPRGSVHPFEQPRRPAHRPLNVLARRDDFSGARGAANLGCPTSPVRSDTRDPLPDHQRLDLVRALVPLHRFQIAEMPHNRTFL